MEHVRICSERDGLGLDLLVGIPGKRPLAVVQLLHGMCEHKERYLPFMEYLNQKGLITVIHDHRGHGRSVKERSDLGYMNGQGSDVLAEDARCVTAYIRNRFGGELPLLLLGHSMGSLTARVYARQYGHDLKGLILCGVPSYRPALPFGIAIAKILKRWKGDRFRSGLLEAVTFGPFAAAFCGERQKFAWICSNRQVAKEYEESPLCGFRFTVDGYLTLFGLMKEAYCKSRCQNPALPVLVTGGSADPCMGDRKKAAKTVQSLREEGYGTVLCRRYGAMRHEILQEDNREQVFADLYHFIKKTLREDKKEYEM